MSGKTYQLSTEEVVEKSKAVKEIFRDIVTGGFVSDKALPVAKVMYLKGLIAELELALDDAKDYYEHLRNELDNQGIDADYVDAETDMFSEAWKLFAYERPNGDIFVTSGGADYIVKAGGCLE